MSFDLNIDNYTKQELASLFELPPNYDDSILEIKESKLRENIMKNTEINKDTQIKTVNFLVKAKTILLNNYKKDKNPELQQKILEFYNTSYELKSSKLEDQDEHMVQVRPDKPYLSSYPSEFFPGVINPLKKRSIKKNLNIFIYVRLLKTIEKLIREAEEQYTSAVDKGLPINEVDRLEENYRKSLKLMDMLETKKKNK